MFHFECTSPDVYSSPKSRSLTANESDRVVRYADLLARATDLFGDEEAAADWLSKPAPALDGETPLAYATTELGTKKVLNLIGRMEHGIPT